MGSELPLGARGNGQKAAGNTSLKSGESLHIFILPPLAGMPFTRLLDLSSKVFPCCEHDSLSKAAYSLSENGNGYDASNKLVRATVVSHFPAMN